MGFGGLKFTFSGQIFDDLVHIDSYKQRDKRKQNLGLC